MDGDKFYGTDTEIDILGFFTVAVRSQMLEDLSKSKRRSITFGHPDRKDVPILLIGQVGKYYIDDENYAPIDIKCILDEILSKVTDATSILPIRAMIVECSEEVYSKNIYQKAGFIELSAPGEGGSKDLYRLFKTIEYPSLEEVDLT